MQTILEKKERYDRIFRGNSFWEYVEYADCVVFGSVAREISKKHHKDKMIHVKIGSTRQNYKAMI